jgi:hypothetical protein
MSFEMGRWSKGNSVRSIYKYIEEEHKGRLGRNDFTPTNGDMCLCTEHSGDCFNYYSVLCLDSSGKYCKGREFGAYKFGKAICVLSEKEFYTVLADIPVVLPVLGLDTPLKSESTKGMASKVARPRRKLIV